MHAAVTVIQAMLIMLIAVSLITLAMPWTIKIINEFMDVSELNSVEPQFKSCNEKIIETARTGSTNKCIFSISRGELTGGKEGINYKLLTTAKVCDEHELVEIDERNHIWQRCDVSGDKRIFEMRWSFPSTLEVQGQGIEGYQLRGEAQIANITFNETIQFRTLTLYVEFEYLPGETGNVIEISRISMTADKINLKIKIS